MFNQRKARPEHLTAIMKVLKRGELVSPTELVKLTGLTLTAVQGAIIHLEKENKIETIRQNATPRLQIKLI